MYGCARRMAFSANAALWLCRSGDWFYQTVELIGFFLTLGILVAVLLTPQLSASYEASKDAFGLPQYLPGLLNVFVLAGPALLLAIVRAPTVGCA